MQAELAPPLRVTAPASAGRRVRVPRITADRILFILAFAAYITAAAVLVFRYDSFNGDAQARVANAYYVLFSRDPHLAAVGFVWNPLQSLLVLPFVALKVLWPPLATHAFAGNVVSALFMAAAVVQVKKILDGFSLSRTARILLLVAFAGNPMIVYYAANGMTEGLFLFTLLFATRHLMRWVRSGSLSGLLLAAIGLAFAYLARNEAVGPTILAAALVVAVSYRRATGERRRRVMTAATDGTLMVLPFAVAFAGWAIVSWLIVGHPFEQFQSQYGTASQLRAMRAAAAGAAAPGAGQLLLQVASLAPLLPLSLVGLSRPIRRGDLRPLGIIAVLGGAVAFAAVAFLMGGTAGWFRYYIPCVPLGVLASAAALQAVRAPSLGAVRRRIRGVAVLVGALALAGPSIVTSAFAMDNGRIASEERSHLAYIYRGSAATPGERADRTRFASSRAIARYLDEKRLPTGSVMVDTFSPCIPFVVLASSSPRQFVITNDRDFEAILADPAGSGARYMLVPPRGGFGDLDAINEAYPALYETGGGFADLEHQFDSEICPEFRLYRLTTGHPRPSAPIVTP